MKRVYPILLFLSLIVIILYDVIYQFAGPIMLVLQMVILVLFIISIPRYISKGLGEGFINKLLLLSLVFIIYYIFSERSGRSTVVLKSLLYCLLVAVPFYTQKIEERQTSKFFWLLSLCGVAAFYYALTSMREVDENAYGGGYLVLVALPLGLYNLRNKKYRIRAIWIVFILICVVVSLKRGDILAAGLGILAYYAFLLKATSTKGKFKNLFWVVVMAFIFIAFASYFIGSSKLAQTRMIDTQEGNSSNRDILYAYYWNYFLSSPKEIQIIGNGFSGTSFIWTGSMAHNDWLEILIDEGLIGIFFYILVIVSMIRLLTRRTIPNEYKPIIAMIAAIVLVKSFFSMMLFSMPTTILFALLGYMLNPQTIDNEYRKTNCFNKK